MKVLILGHGYLGNVLESLLKASGHDVKSTSRKPQPKRIEFDLAREETWPNLPETECTIWTFAAADLTATKIFHQRHHKCLGRLIVIGSTSCFVHRDGEIVDETFSWDMSRPRVQAEQFLLQQGATVLLSSGIYGPNRNPLDWLRKGLIQDANSVVNLIHVEDLARACISAMEFGRAGEAYIVSNDQPLRWSEIVVAAQVCGVLQNFKWPTEIFIPKNNKFLSNHKIKSEFHIEWNHPRLEVAKCSNSTATD